MAAAEITYDRIDEAAVTASVALPAYGGIVTFSGNVRNHNRGKRVIALEYTAHEPLAISEMLRIVTEAETRWPGACAAIHRLGAVPIGESSVFIAVATPHRPDAFAACRWIIDAVKETVPIWKRETTEDGQVWIEGDSAVPASPPRPSATPP